MRRRLFVMLGVLSATYAHAGGKRGEDFTLSFHIETEATDNPKMIFPANIGGKERFFRRLPEVTHRDVVAFRPFPADDNEGYGVIFQLKDAARKRLAAVTSYHVGRFLLAQSNGRIVDAVRIDKGIEDGILVVWRAITLDEIQRYERAMPRIGEAKKRQ